MIFIKRAYVRATADDGLRILVDRLWPRGVTKEVAKIDHWAKELAPSTELRNRFCHDPAKWDEFQKLYRSELESKRSELEEIAKEAEKGSVTLVYGAKDELYNQAVVLKQVLEEMIS